MYPLIGFLAFFQAPAPQSISLVRDCSDPESVIAVLAQTDRVQVRSSLAGSAKACYSVTATVDGKSVSGCIVGDGFPAAAEFERQRQEQKRAEATPAPIPAPAPPPAPPPALEKPRPVYPVFRDFSARDMNKKPVSLSGLGGKVTLVCFWSPYNKDSMHELHDVTRLFLQLHGAGLNAVGISLSSDSEENNDVIQDFRVPFPTVPNSFGLADRYGLSAASIPRTYVLNANREIVAVGLHGKELELVVRQLVQGE